MPKIVIVIIVVFLAGMILPFIYGAHWAFYLYEVTYFFNPSQRWWSFYLPSLPYSKISVIIMLMVFVMNIKKYQNNNILNLPQLKWIILLWLSYVIVYFYAILPERHLGSLYEFTKLFIIHSIGDRWYGLWVIVGTLMGYYGLLDFGLASASQRFITKSFYSGKKQYYKSRL